MRQLELPPELLKKEVANLDSLVASHPASPCSASSSIQFINLIEFAHLKELLMSRCRLSLLSRICHDFTYNILHHCIIYATSTTTVEGINPAPVEVGSLSDYLQGFLHPRWCRISSITGEVVGGHVGYAVRLDARATRLESLIWLTCPPWWLTKCKQICWVKVTGINRV